MRRKDKYRSNEDAKKRRRIGSRAGLSGGVKTGKERGKEGRNGGRWERFREGKGR